VARLLQPCIALILNIGILGDVRDAYLRVAQLLVPDSPELLSPDSIGNFAEYSETVKKRMSVIDCADQSCELLI
jgi:hypothetical protein